MTDIHSCSYFCERPDCVLAQRDEMRDKLMKHVKQPAEEGDSLLMDMYNHVVEQSCDPEMGGALERLRFICALALGGQDWLDIEPFFDAVKKEQTEPVEQDALKEKNR